jgi:hypothetical protein
VKYVNNYQLIYRKFVKEAKKRDIDMLISSAKNKTKIMWWLMNREFGNHRDCNIEVRNGSYIIFDPQRIPEVFNSYFVQTVEDLKTRNKSS